MGDEFRTVIHLSSLLEGADIRDMEVNHLTPPTKKWARAHTIEHRKFNQRLRLLATVPPPVLKVLVILVVLIPRKQKMQQIVQVFRAIIQHAIGGYEGPMYHVERTQ
jgi:hypothetical protein